MLLFIELQLVVWTGYYSERNAGNAVKELEVRPKDSFIYAAACAICILCTLSVCCCLGPLGT